MVDRAGRRQHVALDLAEADIDIDGDRIGELSLVEIHHALNAGFERGFIRSL
jgi:hypothetical protein